MSKFRLNMDVEYEPPGTWEAVAQLSKSEKIRAVQVFLRKAAIRLHEDAHLGIDDVANAFRAIPDWIASQKHEHKRANAPGVRFKCDECGHVDLKTRFFVTPTEPWLPTCPKCRAQNASRVDDMPKTDPLKLKEPEICKVCAGHPCPVCEQGEMLDHCCTHCHTVLCPSCHGIKDTKSSRAYDTVRRCQCEEKKNG